MGYDAICDHCGYEWSPTKWDLSVMKHSCDPIREGLIICVTDYCPDCDGDKLAVEKAKLRKRVDKGEYPGPILWREVNAERQQAHQNTA